MNIFAVGFFLGAFCATLSYSAGAAAAYLMARRIISLYFGKQRETGE